MPKKKPRVYVLLHNHFDPIWRRCWDRDFVYRGRRYRSYAALEDVIISRWLDMARKDPVKISEGQAVVLRTYIQRNPDRLGEIRDLVREGRFEITGGGEVVPDLNIPSGETIVRNYVLGILWCEDVLGGTSDVCWLEDAFGQSAQVPQIMRGCELRFAARLSYAVVPGDFWRGLDGSVVCKIGDFPTAGAGTNVKYAPHHACNGYGCKGCDYTGMVPDEGVSAESVERALKNIDTGETGWGLVFVGGEEHLPNRKFADIVKKVAKEDPKREYLFGTYADVVRELAPRMKVLDREESIDTSDEVEGNPTSSGCLVTRIRTKQETRTAEALLLSAEHLAARAAAVLGDPYPAGVLDAAWRDLCFTQFHDAVTATHINAAYDEVMDMFAGIKAGASSVRLDSSRSIASGLKTDARKGTPLVVFNTAPVPQTDIVETTVLLDTPLGENETVRVMDAAGEKMAVEEGVRTYRDGGREVRVSFVAKDVPSISQSVFYVEGGGRPRSRGPKTLDIQNEFLRVNVRAKAIAGIVHRETGKSVFPRPEFPANTIFLEDDGGDPWGTIRPVAFRENLAEHNVRSYREDIGRTQRIVIEGRHQGEDPDTMGLAWTQEILLRQGIPRLDFITTVDWDARSRRLRVGFPVGAINDRARYGIPYGNVIRDAYEPRYWRHNMPNGDWPATYWIDIKRPFGGIALLNRGLLSHRMQDGSLYLSLLRSPEDRFCLNEPEFYDCPDYDGALDRGRHRFEYALYPHAGDFRAADVPGRAWAYNHPLFALEEDRHDGTGSGEPWIQIEGSGVLLSAAKKAERGDEIVLRLYEAHGRKTAARIGTSFPVSRAEEANMLERDRREIDLGSPVRLRPHEIKTLILHPPG